MWYALTKPGWALACMIMYFLIVTGHCSVAMYTFTSENICILGAISWPAYLLSPMIYMNMYSRVKEAIFMTSLGNSILGQGGIMITIVITLFFMFLLQYPLEMLVTKTLRKLLMGQFYR